MLTTKDANYKKNSKNRGRNSLKQKVEKIPKKLKSPIIC